MLSQTSLRCFSSRRQSAHRNTTLIITTMLRPFLSNVLLSVAILLSTLPTIRASCYYPDGSFPTDYVFEACGGDSGTCCIPSEGDVCLSNGLCSLGASGTYLFRGACTDKTWNSPSCLQHCKDGAFAGKWQKITACGDNKYCCAISGSVCCNDDTLVFELPSASIINNFSNLTPTATSLPTAAATEAASSVTGAADYTSAATGLYTTTRHSTATTSPTGVSTSSTQSTLQKNKIPIIAGVAGGVAVIVALILGYRCAKRRYKKNNMLQYQMSQPFNPPQGVPSLRPTPVAHTPVPASPPQWKSDAAKMQPWAVATPIPQEPRLPSPQPPPWRGPELDSQAVQQTAHGGVVYEAVGTPGQTRYEAPGQTRPMYEAP